MDVRCEKCHTEYELDDSKVTEAGVTVKCTSCGNLFKIKRKSAQPAPRPAEIPAGDSGAMWLIRSPGGENRRFRELTTLQQWIVERKVTRECEISRTGETWKKLGDIAELASFFAIVDQARAAARPPPATDRKATPPLAPLTVQPARAPGSVPAIPMPSPQGEMSAPPLELEPDPEPMAMPLPAPTPSEPAVLKEGPRAIAATATVKRPPRRDSWSGNAVSADSGEPAWARGAAIENEGNARTVKVDASAFGDEFSDLEMLRRQRGSRTWMWIVAVVAIGGIGGGWLLLREKPEPAVAPAGPDAGAAAPVVTPGVAPDAAAKAAAPGNDAKALDAYKQGVAKLYEDTDGAFTEAEKLLDGARVADAAQDAKVLAALALVETARAQYLEDDAAAAEPGPAAQLRAEAERRVTRADRLAKEAQAKAPAAPEVVVAVADVLRLQKKGAADVDKALAPAGDSPEALYVKGMLRWRDGKAAEAQPLLEKAAAAAKQAGAEHLRARYRLAVIAAAGKKPEAARAQLDAVLAAQPAHARAKALAARLKPTEAAVAPPPAETQKPQPPSARPAAEVTGPVSARDYEGLVKKGDKLAENGNCADAIHAYERALDARPNGVEALTGLGYCSLDHKEYDRALGNFRAALAISPRYSEALIGLAESFRFRGMNAEALTYYKRYLEQSPNGGKAAMARRHVEELVPAAAPAAPAEPKPTAPPPPTPPPLDQLPDKPGATPEKPAEPAAPPAEKLPEKPVEKPAEPPPPAPPPAESSGEPHAPDSPQTK